ncbi:hypothetical protein M2282_004614 [Variovorax boronicumulans]|uniref:hypothetical protein n=1 Tax=Variovorax boronicumulans TaxID=436515 RepID=UPI0024750D8E|nr:hypothetical protein [Variovorax boronicumulans]MDH6169446.1 hypothetical protein [Variovorax boronicumulans]
MALNCKPPLLTGVVHTISSALVFTLMWETIGRRLGSHRGDFFLGYTLISLLLLVPTLFLWGRRLLIAWAAFIPYIAATLSYVVLTVVWLQSRETYPKGVDIFGALGISLVIPFLAIWGPFVSGLNIVGLWCFLGSKKISA